MRHQLLPIVARPLIDAIMRGEAYEPYQENMPTLHDAMCAFDIAEATDYIDLMVPLSLELARYATDDEKPTVIEWCGATFARLVEFTDNEND